MTGITKHTGDHDRHLGGSDSDEEQAQLDRQLQQELDDYIAHETGQQNIYQADAKEPEQGRKSRHENDLHVTTPSHSLASSHGFPQLVHGFTKTSSSHQSEALAHKEDDGRESVDSKKLKKSKSKQKQANTPEHDQHNSTSDSQARKKRRKNHQGGESGQEPER